MKGWWVSKGGKVKIGSTHATSSIPVVLISKCKLVLHSVMICGPTVSHIQVIGVGPGTNSAVASQLTAKVVAVESCSLSLST